MDPLESRAMSPQERLALISETVDEIGDSLSRRAALLRLVLDTCEHRTPRGVVFRYPPSAQLLEAIRREVG